MNRQSTAIPRPAGNAGNAIRTLLISFVSLIPVGVVTAVMLMQILGLWR
ncbi:MAG: hypothetical protein KGJ78_15575 [Alphaproteobacteria bacterium]|nr:hypothetical protein [Alphaproteobacteria bacterium]